jgi:hypothetical protein
VVPGAVFRLGKKSLYRNIYVGRSSHYVKFTSSAKYLFFDEFPTVNVPKLEGMMFRLLFWRKKFVINNSFDVKEAHHHHYHHHHFYIPALGGGGIRVFGVLRQSEVLFLDHTERSNSG